MKGIKNAFAKFMECMEAYGSYMTRDGIRRYGI